MLTARSAEPKHAFSSTSKPSAVMPAHMCVCMCGYLWTCNCVRCRPVWLCVARLEL
jgi:hypothetical protein